MQQRTLDHSNLYTNCVCGNINYNDSSYRSLERNCYRIFVANQHIVILNARIYEFFLKMFNN